MRVRWWWILLTAALFAVTGCARKQAETAWEPEHDGYTEDEPAPAQAAKRSRAAAPAPLGASAGAVAPPAMEAPPPPEDAAPPQAVARMVHYEGWARLRVDGLDESIDALTALAETFGGAVERVYGRSVVIRVPVERFHEAFARVLELGEVMERTVTAEDVTEAYTAVDLRLRTAKATRDRLVALLAKAEDEQEKLELVRQIQRVTEEIDRLEAQVRTLADLAARSRISVELVPREALAGVEPEAETRELAWIRALSPFRSELPLPSRGLETAVPDGMVRLAPKGPLVAESADGARYWTHRVENRPAGDAGFWMEAVAGRLAPEFASAERAEMGDWRVLRLVDRGDEPYTWWIAVRVHGKRLEIAQAFFPSAAHVERHGAAVEAALAAGGEA